MAAELVGNVGSVLVAVGDHVAADDPVMLLESMKMEIPVQAEVAGTVSAIMVTAGEVVREGDALAVIEPDERPRRRSFFGGTDDCFRPPPRRPGRPPARFADP